MVPNLSTFETNQRYDAEELEIYNTSRTGPYINLLGFGMNAAILPLCNITSNCLEIINAARNRDPAASLPTDTDPTFLAGYAAQREIRLQQLAFQDIPAA